MASWARCANSSSVLLRALAAGNWPLRHEVLEAEGKSLRTSLNGYAGWLGIVAGDPHADVFERIRAEERRKGWSISHPTLSRALYCGFAANGDRLWTPEGLAWQDKTLVDYAKVSEYNALRLLGYRTNIEELIRYFERQLPLIHGNFGTSFWAPQRCFEKWGFPNSLIFDRKRFDTEARAADACIVFYHWAKQGRAGAHFVAVKPTTE